MDKCIFSKLESMLDRYYFLEKKMLELNIVNNNSLIFDFYKEHSSLKNIVNIFLKYKNVSDNILKMESLINDSDNDIRLLANDELFVLLAIKKTLEKEIMDFLSPKDKLECSGIFLELRAAAGGDESAIFAEDLFKMYSNFFFHNKWKLEVMSFSSGNSGGYKEIISRVLGDDVFLYMKNESGIHRVQRVPKTETRGRVHTSTCSVAVMPEVKIIDDVQFDSSDLRIDTYRAGGAGGQHVNVTDSAVRITHKPTGIIAECQDERSQHKNKQKALTLLHSRLLFFEKNKQKNEIDDYRRRLIGTGIRSEKIRTYNYVNNRITDHRYNITLYKLTDVMNGKLFLLLDEIKNKS